MIFTSGFIMVLLGVVVINILGEDRCEDHLNNWDFFGCGMIITGIICTLYSVLLLASRYLP